MLVSVLLQGGLTVTKYTVLIAGIVAILLSMDGQWLLSIFCIMGAAWYDSTRRRFARHTTGKGLYDKEQSRLAELISFAIAPATLAWLLHFQSLGEAGLLLAILFPIAGAVRLARFDASRIGGVPAGLPLVIAGPSLALAAVFGSEGSVWMGWLVVALAVAVVSTVRIQRLWIRK